jgi:hypothetical protein
MRTNHVLLLLSLILLIGAVICFWSRQPSFSSVAHVTPITISQSIVRSRSDVPVTPQPSSELTRQQAAKKLASAFSAPISYWGKVVDEKGNPVPDATVAWTANNNPDPYGAGTRGETRTDADGLFFIASRGIGLYVEVWKTGYYQVPTQARAKLGSFGGFDNPAVISNTDSPLGTPDNPAMYALHRKGTAAALIQITERPIHIPKNGSPVAMSLSTGQTAPSDEGGGLNIACWTNDQVKDADGHYTWRCQLSVPGGGLIERIDQYAFEAPVHGYKPVVELGPPIDRWSARAEQQYFVKLPNNCYARIDFRIRTAGDHYFIIESYLNPTPGDRNLEFDPSNAIEMP